MGVELLNDYELYQMDVFGNEVILADEATCEMVNGFKVTEVERIINSEETDHTEYIKDLLIKVLISVLSLALVVCVVLLIRKKK